MPPRVAQSDPNPNSISTDTSQPLDARAQNAVLATYNTAISQANAAQAKLDQMQSSERPRDDANGHDTGGKQWDKDYADASAAVAAAKAQEAEAARQYATVLQQQAAEAAKDTSPEGVARTTLLTSQAEVEQAKADGWAARTDIQRTAAQARLTAAQASLARAQAPKNVQTYTTAGGTWARDDTANPNPDGSPGWRQITDSSGKPLPGTGTTSTIGTNATDQFIISRNPDGTTSQIPNPNYVKPSPTGVATNTTDQFIVTRDADGTTHNTPNPNYVKPTPTNIQTNTTDQFIVQQNADGTTTNIPNPNYHKAPPTAVAADTTSKTIVSRDADGNITNVPNPNYVAPLPKYGEATPTSGPVQTITDQTTGVQTTQPNPNTTDIAAQVQQINQAAHTFRDNLQTQVLNGQLDPDEALQKFHDYWNTTVEPQRQALVDAQQKAQFNQGLQARQQASTEEQNRAASNLSTQQTGEAAGNDAVKRAMDLLPLQVGPQYGQHMAEAINGLATGHPTSNFTSADFTSTAPDMNAIHHQAVAEALKGISPYAASQIGAPMPSIPQGVDVNGLLNQSQYGGSFSAAPSAPAASSATTTIGPDGTVTVQHVPPYAQSGQPSGATPITQATQPIPAYMPRAGNLDSVPSLTY